MLWNDLRSDRPPFFWDEGLLLRAEWMLLSEADLVAGAARRLSIPLQSEIIVTALTEDAVASLELEGEIVDRTTMETAIRAQLGLGIAGREENRAAACLAEVQTRVAQRYASPIAMETLCDIGERLDGSCGALPAERAQFAKRRELADFIRWHNAIGSGRRQPDDEPSLALAGLAHLWLDALHPFRHASGILGRALAAKALLLRSRESNFVALATVLLDRRNDYYRNLDNACRDRDATAWLTWFAAAVIEALRRHRARINFVLERERLLGEMRDRICRRQEALLLHMFSGGPDVLFSGVSARSYARKTGLPLSVVATDLANLSGCGALVRSVRGRSTRYRLNIACPAVAPVGPEDIR